MGLQNIGETIKARALSTVGRMQMIINGCVKIRSKII